MCCTLNLENFGSCFPKSWVSRNLSSAMAAPVAVAAAGLSIAGFFYRRQIFCAGFAPDNVDSNEESGVPENNHFSGKHEAPQSWLEAMYFLAEALRYASSILPATWRLPGPLKETHFTIYPPKAHPEGLRSTNDRPGPACSQTHPASLIFLLATTSHLLLLQYHSLVYRYMYGETLGRWKTADLLIGLAYLARREGEAHPVADIAAQGQPFGRSTPGPSQASVFQEMKTIQRFMKYCLALRERRLYSQLAVFRRIGIGTDLPLCIA